MILFVAGLVSCKGHKPDSNDRNWPYYFTIGTMVRYADDLSLMMKIISQSEEARYRFDQKVSLEDMKFFYLEDCCGITNSIDGEMKEAIQRLRKHLETTYGLTVQKVCFKCKPDIYDFFKGKTRMIYKISGTAERYEIRV